MASCFILVLLLSLFLISVLTLTLTAYQCDQIKVLEPNSGIPCRLPADQTPMFVYFTFDDAVTSSNIGYYRRLFGKGHTNPNGCPVRATFFNSHQNTDYNLVSSLFQEGHELASHSVSHRSPSTWWEHNATAQDWFDEIVGQRENIARNTGGLVPIEKIKGMRSPFLALGGDKQFDMLEENDFVYDSSIAYNSESPTWPFTLNKPAAMNGPICRSAFCPQSPHALWEVVMNVYYQDYPSTTRPCSMVDGCRPDSGRQGAKNFLWKNFRRHYEHRHKVPFGVNMHAAWFSYEGYLDAMDDFMTALLDLPDVYIVPVMTLLEWIQQPLSLEDMKQSPLGCNANAS